MVGLVLVCHSAKLAEGVAEVAAQMGGDGLRIGVAGGLDQPGHLLGTDATLVMRAIEEVWSEDGVLILMDLGSAILSAEMAVDLLPEERRSRVLLTEAPFVEGAVAAAVAAGLGEPLEKVAREAKGGLAAKAAHLGPEAAGADAAPDFAGPGVRLTVRNRLGIHARPAARLVRTAARFDADVTVADATSRRGPVSARSLNAVATLGVRRGDEMLVQASGPQAEQALAAILRLADGGFGEPEDCGSPDAREAGPAAPGAGGEEPIRPTPTPFPPPAGTVLRGLPASPGIGIGPAARLRPAPLEITDAPAGDPAKEWAKLKRALSATAADIHLARESVAGRAGDRQAAIFDAHLLFLEDEALLGPARERVFHDRSTAARAWADAVTTAAAAWDALEEPYQRARAADLRSVGDQVARHLLRVPPQAAPGAGAVVVAPDLTPTEVATLDGSGIQGIACAFGGPTGHGAILARSLGIPAVVGVGAELLAVLEGTLLTLDGDAGAVIVDPPPGAARAARDRLAGWTKQTAEARERARLPAVTLDGVSVHVAANSAGPNDIPAAVAAGADGVGLLRTEFLFLEADHLPTEGEQELAYRTAAEALAGRPLTIRTLDAGADKPLPYLPLAQEQNPFLGVRGLRLGLTYPRLLLGQLRAVLRVAADHPVRVLFPMVTTVDELLRARELLGEARSSLTSRGVAAPEHLKIGIMVEVPAAALTAEAFTPHVDFFSVGTNDLAQYTLAAERGNAEVAALADPFHPALLRLIEATARAAAEGGKSIAVCGEVAGDPLAIPLLLGLGVGELSMAAPRIAAAKQAVRTTDIAAARRLAHDALGVASAAAVRRLCEDARRTEPESPSGRT